MANLQIEADHVVQHRRLESPTLYLRKKAHPRRFTNHVENQRNIAIGGQDPHNNINANHSATKSVDDVGNAWIIQQTKYTFSASYIFTLPLSFLFTGKEIRPKISQHNCV